MSLNTTPATWAAGEIPTAVKMNTEIRDALAGIQAAWTAYAPTVTAGSGTIATASASMRYIRVGKTVHWKCDITITSAGTGNADLRFTLPVAAQSATGAIGSGVEKNLTSKLVSVKLVTAAQAGVAYYDNTTVITSGALVMMAGTYEAA